MIFSLTEWKYRVSSWWVILRIALEERLVYRGDFALGTLMRFLPIITQIFLWWAVFDAIGDIAWTLLLTLLGFYLGKRIPGIENYNDNNQ